MILGFEPFLRAVIEQPDADDVRLIAADWLEEQEEVNRAERIRHGCHYTNAFYGCWGDSSVGMICRESFPCPYCSDLHGEGVPWVVLGESRYRVHRGFVSEVTLTWQSWLSHHQAILDSCPIRRIDRSSRRICSACHGDGLSTGPPECRPCRRCQGTGWLSAGPDWRGDGVVRITTPPIWHSASGSYMSPDVDEVLHRLAHDFPGVRFDIPSAPVAMQ